MKDKVEKMEIKNDLFKCTMCEYKCKREGTLNKHMLTKHQDHACKECKDICSSFIELLKHVASVHFKERYKETDVQSGEVDIEKENRDVEKD